MRLTRLGLLLFAVSAASASAQGALSAAPRAAGDVAWTVAFDTPTRPGRVFADAVGAAPGGDVCAVTVETLPDNRVGAVVARYGPDGARRWAHPVDAWASMNVVPLSITGGGEACVLGATVSSPGQPPVLSVARVDEAGPVWAVEVERESAETQPDQVHLAPDGSGGVWVGVGWAVTSTLDGLIVRLGSDGRELARATVSPVRNGGGVQSLRPLPDGGVVALVHNETLAVVSRTGATREYPLRDALHAYAFVLDPSGATTDALVLGVLPTTPETVVRRIALDGTVNGTEEWTTALTASADRPNPAYRSPDVIARSGDALYVAWRSKVDLRLTRFDATGGNVEWEVVTDTGGVRPQSLVLDAEGPTLLRSGSTTRWGGYAAADGAKRWEVEVEAEAEAFGRVPVLVPCGEGTCRLAAGTLTARDSAGSVAWTAVREGAPYASNRIDRLIADGGAVTLAGLTYIAADTPDLWVARLTADGQTAWSTTIGGNGAAVSGPVHLDLTPDGGAVGAVTAYGPDGPFGILARLEPNGEIRWTRSVEGIARAVVATDDGGGVVSVDRTRACYGPSAPLSAACRSMSATNASTCMAASVSPSRS